MVQNNEPRHVAISTFPDPREGKPVDYRGGLHCPFKWVSKIEDPRYPLVELHLGHAFDWETATDPSYGIRCDQVLLTARHGEKLDGTLRVPLNYFVRLAIAHAARRLPDKLPPSPSRRGDWRAWWERLGNPPVPFERRKRAVDDKLLRSVADLYREALAKGLRNPVDYVKAELDPVSRSTAGRWVMEARKRGHLGPARPRIAGA